jgi:2-polyprenyl-3-methyl-5-hydroxy-6-metoxy-1,4-benzoquinol methylase
MSDPLKIRVLESEVMDDPDLDKTLHVGALKSLATMNWLSASSRMVWGAITEYLRRSPQKKIRILDIATGSGDIPIALFQRARRAGIEIDLLGIDISQRAIEFARQQAGVENAKVEFATLNALSEALPAKFDIVICSLFMHHLSEEDVVRLLAKMKSTAKFVVVNDLRRSRAGWWLALLVTRLFSRSDVVHTDSCLSVGASFSMKEFRALANAAGMESAIVKPRWPFRFLMTWEDST